MTVTEAKEVETLWDQQRLVRCAANEIWCFLFEEGVTEEGKDMKLPRSKLSQMIEYEKTTIGILQDVVETLPKLGKG